MRGTSIGRKGTDVHTHIDVSLDEFMHIDEQLPPPTRSRFQLCKEGSRCVELTLRWVKRAGIKLRSDAISFRTSLNEVSHGMFERP